MQTTEQQPQKWEIFDRIDRRVIGVYTDKRRARNRADRLDLEYGAIRYSVRPLGGWQALAQG